MLISCTDFRRSISRRTLTPLNHPLTLMEYEVAVLNVVEDIDAYTGKSSVHVGFV